MRQFGAFLLAIMAVCAGSCVPTPEDPIDFGVLCLPDEADCSAVVLLERDLGGRNQVDYVVRNQGAGTVSVEVIALVPSAEFGDGEIDPDDLVARREHEAIGPDEIAENRFTAQDLGVRDAFQLGMRCSGCDVELEYVFSTVPRECFEGNDCPAGWQCDDNIGRCAECLVNADCNQDQRCNRENGRCDPPDTAAGCGTVGPTGGIWAALALLVLLGYRRRRDPRWPVMVPFLLLCALPHAAEASPPRASISVGAGPRLLAGELGPLTKRGVGLSVQQELRWRHVGASLSLGTSYFLTTQTPPPFSRSFQTYGVTIGPRLYVPTRVFELVAGADYRRLGTANNSLVRITGTRTSFDALGGIAGARVRWSGLEVRVEGGAHYIVQLDSVMITIDLAVGFTNTQ